MHVKFSSDHRFAHTLFFCICIFCNMTLNVMKVDLDLNVRLFSDLLKYEVTLLLEHSESLITPDNMFGITNDKVS